MKTKNIPFDKEIAEKIQAGEIKGKIRDKRGDLVRLICTDIKGVKRPIIGAVDLGDEESVFFYTITGKCTVGNEDSKWDLVLEVPNNEPQFKPFDRVLVRDVDQQKWACSIFSHLNKDQGETVSYNANGLNWYQCIPYEGNEDLVGTTNMPKED